MMDRPIDPDAQDREPTEEPSAQDIQTAEEIGELITAIIKEIRARQTYVAGNPLIDRFHKDVEERFVTLWTDLPHLSLAIDENRLTWRELEVYSHPVGHDNFAFQFFRDGIRQLAFLPGGEAELPEFLQILAGVRPGRSTDLLATLWHRGFDFIRMEYVDVSEEEALELPSSGEGPGDDESLNDLSEIQDVLSGSPVSEEEEAEASIDR